MVPLPHVEQQWAIAIGGSANVDAQAKRIRELRGMFYAFIGATCWGFSASCVSVLVESNGAGVLWLADTRLFAAGGLFLVAALVKDRDKFAALARDKTLIVQLVAYSLIAVVLMQVSYMNAIKFTNPGTALFLLELSIVMVLVYECIRARRAPKAMEVIAIALALIGVFFIATQGNIGSLGISAIGLVFGVLAAIANAGYIIIPTRLVNECGTLITNALGMLLAAVLLLPFGRPWEVPAGMDASGWLVFAGIVLVGTMLAYVVFLKGLVYAGKMKAGLIGVFEPVSGVIISALWLGTAFSMWDFLGGAAIVSMMVLVTLSK